MPTQQQIMQALGWNEPTWNMYMSAGVNPMQILQQQNPQAFAQLNSADAGNFSQNQTVSQGSGSSTGQPQNTLQDFGPPQGITVNPNAFNDNWLYYYGTPFNPTQLGYTPIGNTGHYVTPSGATFSQPGTAPLTNQQFAQAIASGTGQNPSAAGTALLNHFQQNQLPIGYANPQMESNYLKSVGLNPAQSTYLGGPGQEYFSNNNISPGPGTSLPIVNSNSNGNGTDFPTGGGDPGDNTIGNQQQTRLQQLMSMYGMNQNDAQAVDRLFPASLSAEQAFTISGLYNQQNRPGQVQGAPGLEWLWNDWDGTTGANPAQWGLNLNANQAPTDLNVLQNLLMNINSLKYGQYLPVNFGNLSPFVNQVDSSGNFSTNWTNQEDLFDQARQLLGGGPTGYQAYNQALDELYMNSPLLSGQFRGKTAADFLRDPAGLAAYYNALDSIRQQFGYASRSQILSGAHNQTPLGLAAYAGTPANNVPFSPLTNPLEGFGWSWIDPDGQGSNLSRWMMTPTGQNLSQTQVQALVDRMNQANTPFMFNVPTGQNSPFTYTNNSFGVNTNYFTPPASTPTTGTGTGNSTSTNPFDSIIRAITGGGQQQPPPSYQTPPPQVYTPQTPQSNPTAPAQVWNTQFNPNRQGALNNFSSFNYFGYPTGQGNNR